MNIYIIVFVIILIILFKNKENFHRAIYFKNKKDMPYNYAYPYYNYPSYSNYYNHPYYNYNKYHKQYYPYQVSFFDD